MQLNKSAQYFGLKTSIPVIPVILIIPVILFIPVILVLVSQSSQSSQSSLSSQSSQLSQSSLSLQSSQSFLSSQLSMLYSTPARYLHFVWGQNFSKKQEELKSCAFYYYYHFFSVLHFCSFVFIRYTHKGSYSPGKWENSFIPHYPSLMELYCNISCFFTGCFRN